VQPLKAVAGLACFVALAACGSPAPSNPSSGGQVNAGQFGSDAAPVNGGSVVRYELTGTAVTVDGSYAEPSRGVEKRVDVRQVALPWSRDVRLAPKQLFVAGLSAQGPNVDSTVTCKIIKDGEVVSQETGSLVACHAELTANT
jgi:Mycobacterium membrane protein